MSLRQKFTNLMPQTLHLLMLKGERGRECIFAGAIDIWGFPKIRGTFLGVPIKRIIVFWSLYWGPPI